MARYSHVLWMLCLGLGTVATAAEPTVEELLSATDDMWRGTSSIATLSMYVKTDRYERTMKMQAWSSGTERTLIRILEPVKDAGVSTLMVDDNIWNYLPKVDRTIKVPSGMMSGSWMGSHFTNDDLVKDSRLSDDFTYELTHAPSSDGADLYTITLVPKPDAAVVWGKIVLRVRPDRVPVDQQFYDEDGELVRTMTFGDVQDIGGRPVAMVMTLIPTGTDGEMTRVTYESLEFDADVPASTFTLQALKR